MKYQLGFLGAGGMAEAIAIAAIRKGVLTPGQMIASDPSEARRQIFNNLGVATATENRLVIHQSAQVLIAVKPQVMKQAAADLAVTGRADQVIISIMAGISTAKLVAEITASPGAPGTSGKPAPRVIRVMPNTPLKVGKGMAAICLGGAAQAGDETLAMELFGAGGEVVTVEEDKMDAVTAVSGSGPAYIFYVAEAMERAARELGLEALAPMLVRQTILGAATLLAESSHTPADERRVVTSPGGTTEAAIKHLDGNKTIDVFVNAIKAAEKRGRELGA